MKSFTLASAFLAAAAVAQPHGNPHGNHHRRHHQNDKRDVVTEIEWVTEIEYVTKMVDATTTVWVRPEAEPTSAPQPETTQPAPKKEKKPAPPPAPTTTLVTSAYTPPPPPEPTTEAEAAPESTSQYVAPVKPTTQAPAPQPTVEAPKPKPVSKAPEPETEVAPVQQEKAAKPASGGSSSGGSSAAKHGEFTYYDIGQGACGEDDSGKDDSIAIVALSHLLMGPESNNNPMCGKTITIKANGKTATAIVADKCMGCDLNDIDVSRKVYKEIWGSLDSGRTEVEWWFN
ncbi:rasp f 7 allergen [Fusarium beomiforme]|uniref:Rasp f 7 allergen n=1 Tax=Fusarium beomiforme TaxID=44412 RepID=A0A9P5A9H6_9HYPO|nr:rasp f 7 allergen [Fusarium beomiforme]